MYPETRLLTITRRNLGFFRGLKDLVFPRTTNANTPVETKEEHLSVSGLYPPLDFDHKNLPSPDLILTPDILLHRGTLTRPSTRLDRSQTNNGTYVSLKTSYEVLEVLFL